MTAEIVAVGTEILLGDIVDTNSAELGKTLAKFGVVHLHRQTVGDNWKRLAQTLELALSRSDIVFTIGGLGPTADDVTRDGIASALRDQLIHDPEIEEDIRAKLKSRRIPFIDNQIQQAMRPSCAVPIDNPHGTAPGLVCTKSGKVIIAMPGPKFEFVPMLEGPVSDYLASLELGAIVSITVKIVGMGESMVEKKLADLMASEDPTVAPYAKTGEVHVRVTSQAITAIEAHMKTDSVIKEIRLRLGSVVYGADEDTLESVALDLLRKNSETLAVAESCTGGGLAERLTSIPGSSEVFLGGVVSYSNDMKVSMLGVAQSTIEEHGAVSEECAREMAECVCRKTSATWGVAITGVAGPGGGTKQKPVGLVYIAVYGHGGTTVETNVFPGTREAIRERSEKWALLQLRNRLLAHAAS